MNNKELKILQLTQAMFNAAPGAQFLSEFTAFIDNGNVSTKRLAETLAETDIFKKSMYSDALSNNEFATQFVDNIVEDLVSTENKAWAVSAIEAMLTDGQSRGHVIHWAATALAAVDTADTNWGEAALQFNNKVDVASFYSIDQNGPANTLSVLQQVTADVTNLAASVSATKALFESGVSGNVIDGYIKNATVFSDLNGDGVLNVGEIGTTTDALGNFTLPGVAAFGNLIVSGGTDISTGKPFEGAMTAPSGSTVVNPLTTLIDKIAQNGATTVGQATAKVLVSLGLEAGVDLRNFDPIAETIRTDTDSTATGIALAIHAEAIKVNTLIGQTAALLSGAGISASEDAGIESAYAALAASLAGASSTGTVDLASSTIIAQVIQDAAAKGGANATQITAVAGLSTDASQTIANLNTVINNAVTSSANTSSALTQIAAIQIVAENVEVTMNSGAAAGNVSSATTSTTGTILTSAITTASATVGDVNGDGTSDATPAPSSGGGGGSSAPAIQYLATNATAFTGTSANDVLSISTAATLTPLVMTAVALDGGAGTNTLRVQDGSSIAAAAVSNFTNLTFDATGATGTNDVTMTAAQHAMFSGTVTAAGTGVNGEKITLTDVFTGTAKAAVENYILAGAGANTLTLAVAGQNVTTAANASSQTVDTGTLTSFTGTITGNATATDILNVTATGTDISGATLTSVEQINLASGINATMKATQAALINTAAGTNMVTMSDAATDLALNADVETYTLGNFANTVTLSTTTGSLAQHVAGGTGTDVLTLGAGAYTGNWSSISGLSLVTGSTSIAGVNGGAAIAGTPTLLVTGGGTVSMTAAQYAGFGAITAAGTDAITLTGAGDVTADAAIETYNLGADGRTITLGTGTGATNVTGGAAADTLAVAAGITASGTIDLAGGANLITLGAGAALGPVTAAGGGTLASITLQGTTASMTAADHALAVDIIAAGTENLTLTTQATSALALDADVETYTLGNFVNSITLSTAGQVVAGNALADTVATGALAVTSTMDLAAGANVVAVGAGGDISGATFTATGGTVGYNLDAASTGTIAAAQEALIVSAAGTQNITLSDAATDLALNADVETYTLGNFVNSVTMSGTGQTVVGNANTDAITAGGTTNTMTGGAGAVVDTFNFVKANSTGTALATITDFRGTGLGADVIDLTDVVTAAGTTATIQDLTAESSLAFALDAAANTNLINNGLSMFVWGADTYAFVETTGATATYVASDFVVKLTGTTGHASGATIAGLGFDAI